MKNRDLLEIIRSEIQAAISRGQKDMPLKALDDYLAGLVAVASDDIGGLDEVMLEKYRAKIQTDLAVYSQQESQRLELLRSVSSSAHEAVRSSILINGGAAVALLAFIGHLASIGENELVVGFASSLVGFVSGILAATLAYGFVYFAQLAFYRGSINVGSWLRVVTVVFVLGSLGLFVYGSYSAYRIFLSMGV